MNIKLEEKIESVKKMSIEELCEKFQCAPEEICVGDYIAKNTNDRVCPYKVILGFANFENSDVVSLGNLEIVYGKKVQGLTFKSDSIYLGISLKYSKIKSTGKLRKVYGSIGLNPSITSLENIEFLGSNFYVTNTNLEDFGVLERIDGTLSMEDDAIKCKIRSINKLKKVRKIYLNTNSIKDIGDLEEFRDIMFGKKCSEKTKALFEKNFVRDGSKYLRVLDLSKQ